MECGENIKKMVRKLKLIGQREMLEVTGVSYNGTLPNAVATTGVEVVKNNYSNRGVLVVNMIIIAQMVQSLHQVDTKEKIQIIWRSSITRENL